MDLIIISLKINLFSPWYSWKIAELALNNNHSRTHLIEWIFGSVIISLYDSLFLNINYMMKLKTISFLILIASFHHGVAMNVPSTPNIYIWNPDKSKWQKKDIVYL
jgi:hypothetical protein